MLTARTRHLLALVAAGLALGACGGGAASDDPDAAPVIPAAVEPATSTTAASPAADDELEQVPGLVASTDHDLVVYATVDDATALTTLAATTEFGSRRVLAVVGQHGAGGEWLEVLLPERPNGSRGFVKTADVTLSEVDALVDIDLAARTLRVVDRDDGVVLETAVAVGSDDNPTPTGTFYLTDILITGDEGSAYGPYALGLSAHSDTLSEFGGGDGQIGIHGTNQPASIGQAVSHGCVRVPNDVVTDLAHRLPLGTPVTIR